MPKPPEVPLSRQRVLLGDVSAALRQQMFFWGRDVLTDGNLLLQHGFHKLPSSGLKGTSCYRLPFHDGVIELHGACAGWYPSQKSQKPGFLFIRSTGRCSTHNLHEPVVPGFHDVGAMKSDTAATIAGAQTFISWLAAYETWILSKIGGSYRYRCWKMLAQMPKGQPWLPTEKAVTWLKLFASCGPDTPRTKQMTGGSHFEALLSKPQQQKA